MDNNVMTFYCIAFIWVSEQRILGCQDRVCFGVRIENISVRFASISVSGLHLSRCQDCVNLGFRIASICCQNCVFLVVRIETIWVSGLHLFLCQDFVYFCVWIASIWVSGLLVSTNVALCWCQAKHSTVFSLSIAVALFIMLLCALVRDCLYCTHLVLWDCVMLTYSVLGFHTLK